MILITEFFASQNENQSAEILRQTMADHDLYLEGIVHQYLMTDPHIFVSNQYEFDPKQFGLYEGSVRHFDYLAIDFRTNTVWVCEVSRVQKISKKFFSKLDQIREQSPRF